LYDESIETYNKALIENNDHGIKMGLQKAQKVKKEADALAYIDPVKAEEHKAAGSELFKNGQYPQALKEFDEGIRRNPDSVPLYSNRCATLIKLMDITAALKDAEKCIQLDPKFVKAYARKGNCHHLMKEYHKALKAFEDGLKLDAENKECIEGR
jgi:stress-induced-phosphoprotein 1